MNKTPLHPSAQGYNNRRTRVKRLLALALVLTTGGIMAFWLRYRARNVTVHPPVSLPNNVSRQLSGYTFTRSDEGRRIFTIHAARTLAYNQGSNTVLEDVRVVIFGQSGNRHDELQTDRCRYNNKSGALACSGEASLKLEAQPHMQPAPDLRSGQPFFVKTANVSYDPRDSAVKTLEKVSFSFGPASGTAKGLIYDTRTGSLSLQKDVSARLPARSASGPPVDVRAGGLLYKKAAGEVFLRAPVQVEQGPQRLSASTGTIFLDSQNRIDHLTLEGSVSGSSPSPKGRVEAAAQTLEADFDPATAQLRNLNALGDVHVRALDRQGGVRRLSANQVQMNVSGAKARIRSGRASGNVRLVFEPSEVQAQASGSSRSLGGLAQGKRVLTASDLRFSFRTGGVLGEAHTIGPGEILLIPGRSQDDTRTISAEELRLLFDVRGRLQRILGLNSTHITDSSPPGQKPGFVRETFGRKLVATVNPATQAIETIRQEGDFRFKEGDRRASAEEALYEAQRQKLTLIGHPQMWDSDSRIRARHMIINLAQGLAEGWGRVQSVHFGSETSPVPPGSDAVVSSRTSEAGPLILTADKVIVRKDKQEARYEGNVRAWQGPDVLECSSLKVEKTSQQIRSGYRVTTSLMQLNPSQPGRGAPKGPQSGHGVTQPVTIKADHLVYFNLGREAVYQGHVLMQSKDGTLRSDRLRVYFYSPSGQQKPEVERSVADGNVRVVQPLGRRAQADHAEYFAAAGKIVLTGGPPIIYDEQQGFLTGDRLTFFMHDASLSADGGKKSQTLSKRRIHQR